MTPEIYELQEVIGKRLTAFLNAGEYVLLVFEGGMCCQLRTQTLCGDCLPEIDEDLGFNWVRYSPSSLIDAGVVSAEWINERIAEKKKQADAEVERRERELWAQLDKKFGKSSDTEKRKTSNGAEVGM